MNVRRCILVLALPLTILGTLWAGKSTTAAPTIDVPGITDAAARKTIAQSKYTDVQGNVIVLGASQPAAMAFVFMNTECPISNKLVPEFNRIAALAQKENVEFYGVLSDPTVSRTTAQKHSKDYAINFPMLF